MMTTQEWRVFTGSDEAYDEALIRNVSEMAHEERYVSVNAAEWNPWVVVEGPGDEDWSIMRKSEAEEYGFIYELESTKAEDSQIEEC
jgi:hypothetical protein